MDLDLALRVDRPTPLTAERFLDDKREFEKWERSNLMSLMIIKCSILNSFRGAVSNEITDVKNFLAEVENVKNDKNETKEEERLKQEKVDVALFTSKSKDSGKKRKFENKAANQGSVQRKQNNDRKVCFFCGKSGHLKKNCIKYQAWLDKRGKTAEARPYRSSEHILDSKTVSSYFIGYSERSRGFKFYNPTLRNIFETVTAKFFEDVEFEGRNIVSDIAFEEEPDSTPIVDSGAIVDSDNVQVIIPVIVQEAYEEPHEGNVNNNSTQNEIFIPKEQPFIVIEIPEIQTQQPQELRRSTREMRSAIPDDYVTFLLEHEDNGMLEDDPINFQQALKSSNSQKWINAMNEEIKSMYDNKVCDLTPLPEGAKPVGCQWIFKIKMDSKGNVERYKA
ncbi:hypothetical protein LIER_21532 [Lithospermum erythrorhizon]|uniref:CCHC-type domain-containing protein n=1 Tax=Lithospermum erythrorhizon TaxID=34254 RepID=A0AAV3QS49_LITER